VQTGYGDAGQILARSKQLFPMIEVYPDLAAAVDRILGAEPCS